MSKFKIAVYAICKNEEKFVSRWVESMSEADGIYVLDTGSSDDTVKMLKDAGVNVKTEIINPWRFDVARNKSLELVPDDFDICVCTDFDELLHKGWRENVEKAWQPGVKQLRYRYTWNFNPDGTEGSVFWIEKIHARNDFRWIHPVHEVLEYTGAEPYINNNADGVQLDHHADDSKSRGQYLKLLELSVQESPEDDRNMHYLGREYMFHGMWKECKETLEKHLLLKSATWRDERSASMRYLARACCQLMLFDDEEMWIFRAIAEAPYLREPWLEASEIAIRHQNWIGGLYFAEKALSIKNRSRTYINEASSWGAKPYDLAAISAYYSGLYGKALDYGKKATETEPNNQRLLENLKYYKEAVAK